MATVALQMDEVLDYSPRPTAPAPRRQACVLLIEDSEEAMWLVRFALEEYGEGKYRLEWCSSLCAGLDQISRGGIDIILLDLGLPESSGPESYAWIREVAPSLPVVVLTGDAREETEFAVTASGAEGYLVKDQVSGMVLLDSISSALHANKKTSDSTLELLEPPFRL